MNILNKGSILLQIKNYFSKPIGGEGEAVVPAGKEEAKFEKEESGIRFGLQDEGTSRPTQPTRRRSTRSWRSGAAR